MNAATFEQTTDRSNRQLVQSLPAYGDAIDQGLHQLSSQAGVSANDIDLCQTLRSEMLDLILSTLNQSEQRNTPDQTARWGWWSWMDTHALRIGFLTIHENKPVPIHDHPGSSGLLVVLRGRLQVQQFTALQAHSSMRRIKLSLDQELEAGPCEFVTFSPSEGNIHSISSVKGPCIVLDILLRPYKEQERGWYMAIDESRRRQTHFHTVRVSRSK